MNADQGIPLNEFNGCKSVIRKLEAIDRKGSRLQWAIILLTVGSIVLPLFQIRLRPTEDLFAKKQYCQEIGHKYRLEELKTEEEKGKILDANSTSLIGDGQYVYSKELNTCLYANEKWFQTPDISRTEYFIIDLATNNKLASWVEWDKGCDDCRTSDVSIDMHAEYTDIYNRNFIGN